MERANNKRLATIMNMLMVVIHTHSETRMCTVFARREVIQVTLLSGFAPKKRRVMDRRERWVNGE